jgi:hypothetical protein
LISDKDKNFLFFTASKPYLGSIQLPIQWAPESISNGVKRSGDEAGQAPETGAEVKNGAAIPLLPIRLYGVKKKSYSRNRPWSSIGL